jgi:fatty acid-binding protein DegV
MMKIKPIGTLEDGKIELIHNSRTQNASVQFLKKEVSVVKLNSSEKCFFTLSTNSIIFACAIPIDFTFLSPINVTTPIISTHTGQGAIGLVVLRS